MNNNNSDTSDENEYEDSDTESYSNSRDHVADSHEYSHREDPVPVLDNEGLRKLIKKYKKDREHKLHPIGTWDVSNVTDMKNLFANFKKFNEPLNGWDDKVSNVRNMEGMFSGCTNFNRPLNGWVVSNVRNMKGMFSGCTKFNRPLDDWDVSRVKNMEGMFRGCKKFNKSLDGWDDKVSNVKNMSYMFYNCEHFNQPLNNWNVSNVRNMSHMFYNCTTFNQSLKWQIFDHKRKFHRNVQSMFDKTGMSELNKNETIGNNKTLYDSILQEYSKNSTKYDPRLKNLIHARDDVKNGIIDIETWNDLLDHYEAETKAEVEAKPKSKSKTKSTGGKKHKSKFTRKIKHKKI